MPSGRPSNPRCRGPMCAIQLRTQGEERFALGTATLVLLSLTVHPASFRVLQT